MTPVERFGGLVKIVAFTIFFLALGMLFGKFLADFSSAGMASPISRSDTSSITPAAAVERPGGQAHPAKVSGANVSASSRRTVITDAQFEHMTRDIRKSIGRFRGRAHVYMKNLETGREWTYNADQAVPSASLIKLPVMIGVYEKIASGDLDPEKSLVLTSAARRAGSGQLKWRRNGEQFTVEELLEEMITVSDNIAQEMLIQAVGIEYLKSRFASYGLKTTNITREGLSVAPRTRIENYTTAREMGQLLEILYAQEKFSEQMSEEILGRMKRVKYHDRLPRHIPKTWQIAHKTGLVRRACHDVGIVYSPAGDYIICVLTTGAPSYRDAKRFISKVAAITYRHYDNPAAVATTGGSTPRPIAKRSS